MDEILSPRYAMKLAQEVFVAISDAFPSKENALRYVRRFRVEYHNGVRSRGENFRIIFGEDEEFHLEDTLHSMKGEDLVRIAIDIGVDTPGFLPAFPTLKNELKSDYKTAYDAFTKASRSVLEDPSTAILLAHSALEGIMKEITNDKRFSDHPGPRATQKVLTDYILKKFHSDTDGHPEEIKRISRSMESMNQAIEDIRSKKTHAHGKANEDYLITDAIYSQFIINSVTAIGIYMIALYKNKYPKTELEVTMDEPDDELPF